MDIYFVLVLTTAKAAKTILVSAFLAPKDTSFSKVYRHVRFIMFFKVFVSVYTHTTAYVLLFVTFQILDLIKFLIIYKPMTIKKYPLVALIFIFLTESRLNLQTY